jgi:ribose transport system ATP-binding protein
MSAAIQPLLSIRDVHKRFPGVHALKGVSLDVHAGEVHALLGENGAGKSTLMHLLAGVYQPDSGTISFAGEPPVTFRSEHDAQQRGIAIVFQERSLFGQLSVAENIFAARQPVTAFGRIDHAKLFDESRKLLGEVGLNVHPAMLLQDLTPAEQQMIEIAKALSLNARLLILDEPTAALTETETSALFAIIRKLKLQGVAIIYISHRLDEIFEIADRVTVLKDGEGQGTFPVAETDTSDLVRRMVGRELSYQRLGSTKSHLERVPVLEVRNLSEQIETREVRMRLRNISFQAFGGEVLGFSGLAGAGRTELALSIFGARRWDSGEVRIQGKRVQIRSPRDAIALGIGYLPEDRKEAGLFLEMSVAENTAAARLDRFGSWWFNRGELSRVSEDFRRQLRIACHSVAQPVQTLSGGNQQKVVLSKWLLVEPKVLIVDEPTRGIDVGAKAEVHALLRKLAAGGTAVIVISSDLPEILSVSDRILVMSEGRITGELTAEAASEEAVMHYASINTLISTTE